MHSAECSTLWWCSNLQYPNIWSIDLKSRLHSEHLKDSIIIRLLFTEMLLVTFLLYNWSLLLWSVYYILYFRDGKKISRDYNPVSDDRASRINNFLMYGTQISRTCFNIFITYSLNSYVDLLIFLEYSLSVAILGCHSLFNLSVNVYFLKYLLANLLIQVWYLLAGLYVTYTISCLFLML